jgi:hypothetical protein
VTLIGQSFFGAGDLDQQIGALRPRVQVLGFGNCRLGVMRQERRDFQRNPSVHTAGAIVDRPEQVRGLGEILQRQLEEQSLPQLALRESAPDRVVVVIAVLDCVVEDRRIGREPGDRQLVDVMPKDARSQQVA